jgi:hypothetical protein
MANMNNSERLNLKRLIDEMDCGDNTENIRKLKHSVVMRDDIRKIEVLKRDNSSLKNSDPEKFVELCQNEAAFLFNNYTDIFNKIMKDELDLDIMTKLLIILKMIEDGKVDQHEGSVMVGKALKELYIDSATKRLDNIDKEYESQKIKPVESKKISWTEYKKINL